MLGLLLLLLHGGGIVSTLSTLATIPELSVFKHVGTWEYSLHALNIQQSA